MTVSRAEARELLDRVLALSRADEARANLRGARTGNTRFANNGITSSGEATGLTLEVTSHFGRRTGRAQVDEFNDEALRAVVTRSEELARLAPEDPEHLPELEPQPYGETPAHDPATGALSSAERAADIRHAAEQSSTRGLIASGYYEHSEQITAVVNTRGLFGYQRGSLAEFSTTVRAADGTGSGWAGREGRRIADLEVRALANRAIEKAERSVSPRSLEPGRYSVVLEPQAVADLLQYVFVYSLDAREADEGRSFFSKPGGGNKIGEAVAEERVTIISDPWDPRIASHPFTNEGLPRRRVVWIEDGVLRQLYYDRFWAEQEGVEPTGRPANLIMAGDDYSVDDLIQATERGILVTHFFYIRFVDPQSLLLTGLTRDGTFLIENGRVRYPIKNFRWNESPMAVLKKIELRSRAELVDGEGIALALVPAIKAREFTFTSVSEAI